MPELPLDELPAPLEIDRYLPPQACRMNHLNPIFVAQNEGFRTAQFGLNPGL